MNKFHIILIGRVVMASKGFKRRCIDIYVNMFVNVSFTGVRCAVFRDHFFRTVNRS